MIGLDTNVLVRYLTRDDPAEYAKAAAFIDAATDRGERFLVNTAVLCELAWVLGTAYDYSRDEIAKTLDQIFATAQFDIERLDDARQALGDFRTTKADFSDALIGRINRSLGARAYGDVPSESERCRHVSPSVIPNKLVQFIRSTRGISSRGPLTVDFGENRSE